MSAAKRKTTEKPPEKKGARSAPPAVAPDTLPAVMSFEDDAGVGMEGADRDSYAIPFLVVLQRNNPQCDEDNAGYVKGARAGMFYNTATQELYNGQTGALVVPAHFRRRFVEWVPRDEGGGYRGDHAPEDVDQGSLTRDESGRFLMPNGNHLADTRYHFCIHVTDEGPKAVVIALMSTQIKTSRLWMTMMSNLKMTGKDGNKFTPPTFSHAYRLTTVSQSNDKGAWKGVTVAKDHMLTKDEDVLYSFAKEFRDQVKSGTAKVEQPGTDDNSEEF